MDVSPQHNYSIILTSRLMMFDSDLRCGLVLSRQHENGGGPDSPTERRSRHNFRQCHGRQRE